MRTDPATSANALTVTLVLSFAQIAAADCAGPPPQPPLPDTISREAKTALAPIVAPPADCSEIDITKARAAADAVQAQMSQRQLEKYRVKIESGRIAGVPVRTFVPEDGQLRSPDTLLVNLHGGGFMVDSGSLTENIPIAALTRTKVVSVLYRLAPEHPFPAAVDDVIAVYRELLKSYRPERIVLYGTSAGGILAAQTLVRLQAEQLPMPAALGFFSASADFARVGDSEQYLPGIGGRSVPEVLSPYVGRTERTDPRLSPLYADLSAFPPTLLLAGTRDPLLSHTSLFHRALLRAGITAELVVFEAMPHAHWAWLDLPESTEAFEIMARFFDRRLSASVANTTATRIDTARVSGTLPAQITEEGQRVVFDRYTWQRRELAKRLPLEQRWPDEREIGAAFAKHGLDDSPVAELIPTPAMIVPGVYLVGSNPNHTYLIDGGREGVALIDPGLASNFDAIVANVERLGFSRKQIRWVLNTHAHFDHSMANELFRRLGAKILIGSADADAIEKATRVTGNYFLPPEALAAYPRTKVDGRLADGEELVLGNKTLHVIHTPGHTAGSSCFLLQLDGRNILFTGDTLLYDHRLGAQVTAYADNRAYVDSLGKLARFTLNTIDRVRWDMLLPGHGALALDRAYMDVDKGWRTVQIDLLEGDPVDALPFATDRYRKLMYGRP